MQIKNYAIHKTNVDYDTIDCGLLYQIQFLLTIKYHEHLFYSIDVQTLNSSMFTTLNNRTLVHYHGMKTSFAIH